MVRYGEAARAVVRLEVAAERLIDLRDAVACAALGIDTAETAKDWLAALARSEEPASWSASDRARMLGAQGLVDGSRHAPGAWHLVMFGWNDPGGARVSISQ